MVFIERRNEQSLDRSSKESETRDHLVRPYPGFNYDFVAINVNSTFRQGLIPDGEEAPWGLLRVITAARELHHLDAGILDAHRLKLDPNEVKSQLLKTRPKVIGLNPTSVNVSEGQIFAEICDEIKIPYIAGGVHATLDSLRCREDFTNACAVVKGSGEVVIGELVRSIVAGEQKPFPGVLYKNSSYTRDDYAIKLSPDQIPTVNTNLIEEPIYRHRILLNGKVVKISEATMYVTSGCPFDCSFCASPTMVDLKNSKKPYMKSSTERIVGDIRYYLSELGANAIHFLDNMMFVSEKDISQFYSELVKSKIIGSFLWRGSTRAPVINRLSEQGLEKLRESGAWRIAFGIESGNDQVLEKIGKRLTKQQVVDAVSKLANHGIQVKGFFVMGFPGETEKEIIDTATFIMELKQIGLTEISVFQFKPYPGTRDYDFLSKTKPEVLGKLKYLKRKDEHISGKAKARAEEHIWLPDDLRIAAIPSGRVREYIITALEKFYETRLNK